MNEIIKLRNVYYSNCFRNKTTNVIAIDASKAFDRVLNYG